MKTWFEEELLAGRPPERLTISECACKYRELGKLSAVKGLYPLEMAPFFGPIMDRCASPDVDEQSTCKPAQIGGTVALVENPAFYYIFQEPSSMMICLADQETAKFVATEKIAAMIRDSQATAHLYDEKTYNKKEIDAPNGAHIDFAWASSVARIASRPERIVIGDEVDKPGYYAASKEAAAISLLRERTKSYPDGFYKHIWTSTPTDEEGNITALMKSAEVLLDWHVPCPECGLKQPLRWSGEYCYGFKKSLYRGEDGALHKIGGVVWQGGRDATKEQIKETARYQCGECKALWTTEQKNEAVRNGVEVSRRPMTGKERKYWNHINRIYSLMDSGRLENLVSEWVDIFKHSGEKFHKLLQGFVNSALAEPFKRQVKNLNDSILAELKDERPDGTVPGGGVVQALTAAVDTQDDGFWYEVRAWGWGQARESWQIRAGFVDSFQAVEEILWNSDYTDPDGNRYFVRLAIQDAMGHRTDEVYEFCRLHIGAILPYKGEQSLAQPFVFSQIDCFPGSKKPIPGGLRRVRSDTNYFKNVLVGKLAISPGDPGAWHFNSETSQEWLEQMTAEFVNDKGLWECPKGKANHGFDCSHMNILAAEILGLRYQERPEAVVSPRAGQKPRINPYTGGRY